jgi:hypothetical protein
MKILIAHEFVMGWRMMFGKIIGTVGFPGGPVEFKLLLTNAIFEPVIMHVKGFRFFHADLSMENAVSSAIAGLKRSSRLQMAYFDESSVHGNYLLGIEKELPVSASEAEAAIVHIVLQRTWMTPLSLGVGGKLVALGRSVKKKWPAAKLQAFGRTR